MSIPDHPPVGLAMSPKTYAEILDQPSGLTPEQKFEPFGIGIVVDPRLKGNEGQAYFDRDEWAARLQEQQAYNLAGGNN